jgi:hypothetical protein
MLHKDFEVLISKMPKVLKELWCQGEVLCHLEVLCLIEPCYSVRNNEGTNGMLLLKIHPKHKGLIWKSNDLNLIFKIKCHLYNPAVLV